jgi:hypothetical protein
VPTPETPVEQLYRAIRVATAARFHASRRLRLHQSLSLWAISLSSAALIILSLLEAYELEITVSSGILSLAQVTAAILVLVISLLVNGGNFGERAEKMHRCGLELNALSREVYLFLGSAQNEKRVRDAQRRYDDILSRYENHSQIDYRRAQSSKAPEYYNVGRWHKFVTYALLLWVNLPYLALLLLVVGFTLFVVLT